MTSTFLITGATSGIGRAVAHALAEPQRRLLLVARDPDRAQPVATAVRSAGAHADILTADLSSIRQTYELADTVAEKVDDLIVVHSAGVVHRRRTLTADGIEATLAVQYLSRHVLGWQLLHRLGHRLRGVFSVAGGGAVTGTLDPDNLQGEKTYSAFSAVRATSIVNDALGLTLADAMTRIDPDPASSARSWVYGPGLVYDTGFVRDLPAPIRLTGPLIGRLAGVRAATAATRIASLATSRQPSGLYRGDLARTEPHTGAADLSQRYLIDTLSRDLVRTVLPDWPPSTAAQPR